MYRYSTSSQQTGFRSDRPLDNGVIARYAPSVLADSAHASRGERYAFIPTVQVIDGLRDNGFYPVEVRQTKTRDAGRREFTKHLVRLRRAEGFRADVGEEVPELVLVNSHDGSSSYQLLAGFFRLVCSNGLIAGDVVNDVRIRHSGRVVDDVIEGSFRVLDNIETARQRIETYKSTLLLPHEKEAFATAAARLRWDDPNGAPVAGYKLLTTRRLDDRKHDLWTVFNTVQENLIRGGLRGHASTGRRLTTRGVTGVNEDVRLNRSLWTLADQLARRVRGEPDLIDVTPAAA